MTASELPQLVLERLGVWQVRNLEPFELHPASRLNVITGHNGHGKTSVLEAIYLLATSRSFRTSKLTELVRHGLDQCSVRGRFSERRAGGDLTHEQSCGLERGKRVLRVGGEAPQSHADYATRCPVVVFEPRQLSLSSGPATGRRTLLDRVTLFQRPDLAVHRSRYTQALRARQRLLAQPRASASELDAFESLLATHGAILTQARQDASPALTREVREAFRQIADPSIDLELRYRPGGTPDPTELRETLAARRPTDAQRRRSGFGPHLDDLELRLAGHPARVVGSQGQHRAITLALKLAELRLIAQARKVQPILLLDDVSSELDPERTEALFRLLADTACQIFLTTTRPTLIMSGVESPERQDFLLRDGQLTPA